MLLSKQWQKKLTSERSLKLISIFMLALIAVAMSWGAAQIAKINTHYSMSQFMPKEHPLFASDRLIKKTFKLTDQEPIIINLELPEGAKGTWFQPERMALVAKATEALQGIEGVEKITSLSNVEIAADKDGSIQVDKILTLVPEKDWKKRVLSDPLLTPGLASKDGRVVTIIGDIGYLTETQVAGITKEIQKRILPIFEGLNAKMHVSGVIPLQNQMTTLLSAELVNFFGLAFLMCLVTLVLYFRSPSTVIMNLILVIIANITTLASLALLGIPFSVLSSVLPIICSIEALALGSHTLLLFSENYRQALASAAGAPVSKARVVWSTYRGLIGPNFLMSTTTIVGFATLIISSVPLIRQFALSVATGILVSCIFISITMAPLMLLFPIPVARSWTGAKARWALWVIENRKMVVATTFAVVAILVVNGFRLNWSVQLYDDLPVANNMKSSAELIDSKLGGMIPLEIMITKTGEQDPWNDPSRMQRLSATLKKWRKDPAIGSAIGLPDLLNTGGNALTSRQSIAETLFLYSFGGAENPASKFLSNDGASTRMIFRFRDIPADHMGHTLAQVKQDIQKRFPQSEVTFGGMASMVHPLNAELSGDLIYGLWHSLFLISIILIVVFRSVRLALIAAVPNLLPPFALLATMTYLNTPVKPVVAIIFSIALGLAYNNTVFLLTRLQKVQKTFTSAKDVILRTWYQEGNPCFFSSIAVIGGFAVFLASYFSPNRTFGAYMLWSIGVGLVGDLVLLPALLRMFPWFIFPGEQELRATKLAAAGGTRTRNAIIFLALLYAATPTATAADNVVKMPVLISMPKPKFAALINEGAIQSNLNGASETPLEDIHVTDPFQVSVTGIKLGVRYNFEAPIDPANPSQWLVKQKRLAAQVTVAKVTAHQVIKVIRGGTEIEVRLDGECNNVRLELPEGKATASGRLTLGQREGSPRLEMRDFAASWEKGSWRVVSMSCTGPEGFDQMVGRAAAEKLQTIDPFIADLRSQIQAGLDNALNDKINLAFGNPLQPQQTARLLAPPARANANGDMIVKGDLYFYFKPGKGGCGANIADFAQVPQPKKGEQALFVPFAALKALFACTHSDGSLAFATDSTKFAAWKELMGSWFSKNAVWPDLNSFNETDLFKWNGVSAAPPEVTNEKAASNTTNAFTIRLAQRMNVLMRAPKDGRHVNYMNISAFYTGPVYVSVANSKVTMKMMEGGSLALNGKFDADYVRNYDPKQDVDWARLTQEAKKGLAGQGWSFEIPAYGVSKNLRLVTKDGQLMGSNYRLGMELVKTK